MPIKLTCSCGRLLRVADEFAGRQGQCPACGALLPIPERAASGTEALASCDEAAQAAINDLLESVLKGPSSPGGVITHNPKSTGEADDNGKLTGAGCVLTLLTVALIFGVAVPIVRWRDPETGEPLPRFIAIFSPLLIGAAVHGIASLFLKLIGLPVWVKREKDAER